MPIFRKQPPQTTYLECYSDNGWVYLVIGTAGRYSVELHKGSQRFVMAEYSDLPGAQKAALWLLDNGAEPDNLRRKAEALRRGATAGESAPNAALRRQRSQGVQDS